MKGINYIINESGERVAVMLDLNKYRNIWDEIYSQILKVNKKGSKKIELEKRKKDFFRFIEQHSYMLPEDYKFNREELHER